MTEQGVGVLGVDFGTTNTVLSLCNGSAPPAIVRFPSPGSGSVSAFRSVLSFRERDGRKLDVDAGPWAIEAFLDDPTDTRLVQSFKTFAASASFSGTMIAQRRFLFEDIMSTFLVKVRSYAGDRLRALPSRAVVGRPVVFSGANPDEALAIQRYREAFGRFGLHNPIYAYEPIGAAFYFAKHLQTSATVLVADFGGGTSDFSVMRFERGNAGMKAVPLSRSGVGVAGDAFDYRIIDNVISPRLGKGDMYRVGNKLLPVPSRYYASFARWNQLALLKGSRDLRDLRQIARTAVHRDALEMFVSLISNDQGYGLYRAVSAAKERLSTATSAQFSFQAEGIEIDAEIERAQFERWISPELRAIETAVDQALDSAGVTTGGVDRVFLTGGSSFVPAVRAIFYDRFAADSITTGGEFESIASGLALIGLEPEAWSNT